MSDPKVMRTTTLEIEKPLDFTILEREFRLVYYCLPASYVKAPKRSRKYEKLHVQLKNQLHQPYKTFDYALLEEGTIPVVYVLYRRNEKEYLDEKPIELTWSSRDKMQPIDIGFDRIPFHILIKLLQADYFRGNRAKAFISQGDFFIIAKQGREGNGAICLAIEIKGDRYNTEDMTTQVFQVIASARRFTKIKDPSDPEQLPKDSEKTTSYFRRETRGAESVFSQVREKELATFIEQGYPLFKIKRRKDKKPTLPYHDQLNLFVSRAGILYEFVENFLAYLGEKGISARQKFRTFTKFAADQGYANLPLSRLGQIQIFDNRVSQDKDQLQGFLSLLSSWLVENKYDVDFTVITKIPKGSPVPTLLLQDHEKKDFLKKGRFFEQGITDPKLAIYRDAHYKVTPKQSLNICATDDLKAARLRLHVALNQLLLKDLIVNQRSIGGILPGFPASDDGPMQLSLFPTLDPTPLREYAFVRRKTYDGKSRTTVVSFRDDQLRFTDVSDEPDQLYKTCESMRLDWDAIYFHLHEINFRIKNGVIDEGRELKRFDLILKDKQALVIEDIHETVLYEYGQMDARQKELDNPIPLDNFRLLNRAVPKNNIQARQFADFEDFLDEIAEELTYGQISFNQLTDGEWGTRVAKIFGLPTNNKGNFKFGNFKRIYQQPELRMFLSDKATSLHTYQGIWYDSDQRYLVGEPDGIKRKQATANLIRRFTVLAGQRDVDIALLLSTTGVQFIRPKRYTVYPYFFNLIDMFVNAP